MSSVVLTKGEAKEDGKSDKMPCRKLKGFWRQKANAHPKLDFLGAYTNANIFSLKTLDYVNTTLIGVFKIIKTIATENR